VPEKSPAPETAIPAPAPDEEFRLALEFDPSLATTPELSPKIATLAETAQARLR
jgi:hypothetical protein